MTRQILGLGAPSYAGTVLLDAIVLAGGRSSRLGGVPKAELIWRGESLRNRTVAAAESVGCRRIIVVGPGDGPSPPRTDSPVIATREQPVFGGPAAAIGEGMSRVLELADPAPDAVLVLACDMPAVHQAAAALIAAVSGPERRSAESGYSGEGLQHDGVVLIDSAGRRQPLAAVYRSRPLAAAIRRLRETGRLEGGSMTSLTAELELQEHADPEGWTRDIDTWDDAARFGIPRESTSRRFEAPDEHEESQTECDDETKDHQHADQ